MQVSSSTSNQTIGLSALSSADLIIYIKSNFESISYKSLFKGLEQSTTVINQIIFRSAILSKDAKKDFNITIEKVEKKAQSLLNNRRKRFVRRVWNKYPLFALDLIRERYTDYSEALLISDITLTKKVTKKTKFKKNISSFGLRVSQIEKLTGLLKFSDVTEKDRNTICNKIAGYVNGLKLKLPILLTVTYAGEAKEYSFNWNETESKIKTFVGLTKLNKSFADLDAAWSTRFSFGN